MIKISNFYKTGIILFIICAAVHFNGLFGQFMIDDFGFLFSDRVPKHFVGFIDYFTTAVNQHYTPLHYLLNVVLFKYFPDAFLLHVFNLFFFWICCLVLYLFLNFITKQAFLSLLTVVLFCIHPVNADTLNHITCNFVFLFGVCLLASWAFFIIADNKKGGYYLCSVVWYFLALLLNEIALIFPLYLVNSEYFLAKKKTKQILKSVWPFIMLSGIYFILWRQMVSDNADLWGRFKMLDISVFHFFVVYLKAAGWYVSNLFIPDSIVFMYNVKPAEHIGKDIFYLLIAAAAYLFMLVKSRQNRLKLFALHWFLIGFVITIPMSVGHASMGVVFEPYWMLFPSIGFFFFVSLWLIDFNQKVRKGIFFSLLAVFIFYFSISTQQQHFIARTELGYAQYWLRKSPGNTIALMTLGTIYAYADKAEIPEEFIDEMSVLAHIYIREGDIQKGELLLKKIKKARDSVSYRR